MRMSLFYVTGYLTMSGLVCTVLDRRSSSLAQR